MGRGLLQKREGELEGKLGSFSAIVFPDLGDQRLNRYVSNK